MAKKSKKDSEIRSNLSDDIVLIDLLDGLRGKISDFLRTAILFECDASAAFEQYEAVYGEVLSAVGSVQKMLDKNESELDQETSDKLGSMIESVSELAEVVFNAANSIPEDNIDDLADALQEKYGLIKSTFTAVKGIEGLASSVDFSSLLESFTLAFDKVAYDWARESDKFTALYDDFASKVEKLPFPQYIEEISKNAKDLTVECESTINASETLTHCYKALNKRATKRLFDLDGETYVYGLKDKKALLQDRVKALKDFTRSLKSFDAIIDGFDKAFYTEGAERQLAYNTMRSRVSLAKQIIGAYKKLGDGQEKEKSAFVNAIDSYLEYLSDLFIELLDGVDELIVDADESIGDEYTIAEAEDAADELSDRLKQCINFYECLKIDGEGTYFGDLIAKWLDELEAYSDDLFRYKEFIGSLGETEIEVNKLAVIPETKKESICVIKKYGLIKKDCTSFKEKLDGASQGDEIAIDGVILGKKRLVAFIDKMFAKLDNAVEQVAENETIDDKDAFKKIATSGEDLIGLADKERNGGNYKAALFLLDLSESFVTSDDAKRSISANRDAIKAVRDVRSLNSRLRDFLNNYSADRFDPQRCLDDAEDIQTGLNEIFKEKTRFESMADDEIANSFDELSVLYKKYRAFKDKVAQIEKKVKDLSDELIRLKTDIDAFEKGEDPSTTLESLIERAGTFASKGLLFDLPENGVENIFTIFYGDKYEMRTRLEVIFNLSVSIDELNRYGQTLVDSSDELDSIANGLEDLSVLLQNSDQSQDCVDRLDGVLDRFDDLKKKYEQFDDFVKTFNKKAKESSDRRYKIYLKEEYRFDKLFTLSKVKFDKTVNNYAEKVSALDAKIKDLNFDTLREIAGEYDDLSHKFDELKRFYYDENDYKYDKSVRKLKAYSNKARPFLESHFILQTLKDNCVKIGYEETFYSVSTFDDPAFYSDKRNKKRPKNELELKGFGDPFGYGVEIDVNEAEDRKALENKGTLLQGFRFKYLHKAVNYQVGFNYLEYRVRTAEIFAKQKRETSKIIAKNVAFALLSALLLLGCFIMQSTDSYLKFFANLCELEKSVLDVVNSDISLNIIIKLLMFTVFLPLLLSKALALFVTPLALTLGMSTIVRLKCRYVVAYYGVRSIATGSPEPLTNYRKGFLAEVKTDVLKEIRRLLIALIVVIGLAFTFMHLAYDAEPLFEEFSLLFDAVFSL